jgi:hypothetical protein
VQRAEHILAAGDALQRQIECVGDVVDGGRRDEPDAPAGVSSGDPGVEKVSPQTGLGDLGRIDDGELHGGSFRCDPVAGGSINGPPRPRR